jgi:hypothetical protein
MTTDLARFDTGALVPASRILTALIAAGEAMRDAGSHREAYAIVRNVEAIVALSKSFDLAEGVQREASECAVRCLYSFGTSLKSAYGDSPESRMAEDVGCRPPVIRQALSLARYTAGQVVVAFREVRDQGEMPTVGIVTRALTGQVKYGSYAVAKQEKPQRDSPIAHKLTDLERRTLVELIFAGFTYKGIAARLGRPVNTVTHLVAAACAHYAVGSKMDLAREALRRGDITLEGAVALALTRGR